MTAPKNCTSKRAWISCSIHSQVFKMHNIFSFIKNHKIKMVNFFHLIIFLLIVETKQIFHRKSSLFIFVPDHLDSYKQIDYNFFFNCTYKLSLRILLYYFSVQEVTKKKENAPLGNQCHTLYFKEQKL